jgi:hypothetical protein
MVFNIKEYIIMISKLMGLNIVENDDRIDITFENILYTYSYEENKYTHFFHYVGNSSNYEGVDFELIEEDIYNKFFNIKVKPKCDNFMNELIRLLGDLYVLDVNNRIFYAKNHIIYVYSDSLTVFFDSIDDKNIVYYCNYSENTLYTPEELVDYIDNVVTKRRRVEK